MWYCRCRAKGKGTRVSMCVCQSIFMVSFTPFFTTEFQCTKVCTLNFDIFIKLGKTSCSEFIRETKTLTTQELILNISSRLPEINVQFQQKSVFEIIQSNFNFLYWLESNFILNLHSYKTKWWCTSLHQFTLHHVQYSKIQWYCNTTYITVTDTQYTALTRQSSTGKNLHFFSHNYQVCFTW